MVWGYVCLSMWGGSSEPQLTLCDSKGNELDFMGAFAVASWILRLIYVSYLELRCRIIVRLDALF